ncbi:MAG: ABC transporter permease [Oscillospiraceae bacterium]|nr:ABC transporter permease [Oscillospiraceae bacterium]
MKKYSIVFFIRQSLNGLFMNSVISVTSVFTLTLCLIFTGCFLLLMINTDINLEKLDSLNKIVFFIDSAYESEEQIQKIKDDITGLENVESIRFISKEEALEKVGEKYSAFGYAFEDDELFANVTMDNPISNSIEITYRNINDVNTLDYKLRTMEGVAKNNDGTPNVKNQVEVSELIKNLKDIVMLVLVGFSLVLFLVAIFIILNTIRLSVYSRKNEIEIMRYIGATNFFIVVPFLLEGVIIGLLSALIAFAAQMYIYEAAISAIEKMTEVLEFIPFSEINIVILAACVLTGVSCGIFGSAVSSRKYLKV